METAEILDQFERFTGKFPRAAVEAAVARREDITPELLRVLEDTVDTGSKCYGSPIKVQKAEIYSLPTTTL